MVREPDHELRVGRPDVHVTAARQLTAAAVPVAETMLADEDTDLLTLLDTVDA